MTRLASGLLACAVALAAGGCAAAMVVEPPADAAHAARAPQISGRIIYDGEMSVGILRDGNA